MKVLVLNCSPKGDMSDCLKNSRAFLEGLCMTDPTTDIFMRILQIRKLTIASAATHVGQYLQAYVAKMMTSTIYLLRLHPLTQLFGLLHCTALASLLQVKP